MRIISKIFSSEGEAVCTIRKLLAEKLCLNFAWFLGLEYDGLITVRPDLSS